MNDDFKRGYNKALYDNRMVGPDSFDTGWKAGYESGYRAGVNTIDELDRHLRMYENVLEYIKKVRG